LENDAPSSALRAYYNLSCVIGYRDEFDESFRFIEDGLALARRLGDRFWEWNFVALSVYLRYMVGDWQLVIELAEEVSHLEHFSIFKFAAVELLILPHLHTAKGQLDEAKRVLSSFGTFAASSDVQERAAYLAASAAVLLAEGRADEALVAATAASDLRAAIGLSFSGVRLGFVEAAEAALAMGDTAALERLASVINQMGAGETTPLLMGLAARLRARLAQVNGASAEEHFETSANILRKAGIPFWLGVALLEHAEWLASTEQHADAVRLGSEARRIFEQLGAVPWLERVDRLALVPSAGPQAHRP
jgi:hypothetical protein